MLDGLRQFSGRRFNMLNREYVEKVISFCTAKADFAAFQAHTASKAAGTEGRSDAEAGSKGD